MAVRARTRWLAGRASGREAGRGQPVPVHRLPAARRLAGRFRTAVRRASGGVLPCPAADRGALTRLAPSVRRPAQSPYSKGFFVNRRRTIGSKAGEGLG